MRNVKIAAIQMQCSTNLQTNLEKAEKMVRQAAGDGAQIILLPELFEREYFSQQRRYDFYHLAKPVEENDAVQMGMRLAKELNGTNEFLIRSNDLFEVVTYDKAGRFSNGRFVALMQDDDDFDDEDDDDFDD